MFLCGRRHACTIIFSSFVSTTEVQPRLGLDHDTTLQKLWEDAHAWRLEHNVTHSATESLSRGRPAGSGPAPPSCVPTPFTAPAPEGFSDSEEVAPSGAAGGFKPAPRRARSPPPPDMIRGAGGAGGLGAAVDIGRPAEQSTEMFRSLRTVALQLEQVGRLSDRSDCEGPFGTLRRMSVISSCAELWCRRLSFWELFGVMGLRISRALRCFRFPAHGFAGIKNPQG